MMGEVAEMMLDGTLCACCGDFLGGDEGYPVYCSCCESNFEDKPKAPERVSCPVCGKKVKASGVGLYNHIRDKHPEHMEKLANKLRSGDSLKKKDREQIAELLELIQ